MEKKKITIFLNHPENTHFMNIIPMAQGLHGLYIVLEGRRENANNHC